MGQGCYQAPYDCYIRPDCHLLYGATPRLVGGCTSANWLRQRGEGRSRSKRPRRYGASPVPLPLASPRSGRGPRRPPHLQAAGLRRLAALAAAAAAEAPPAPAAHAPAAHGEGMRGRVVCAWVVAAGRVVPIPRRGVEVARCRARVAWPAPAAAAAERAAAAAGGCPRDGCAAASRRPPRCPLRRASRGWGAGGAPPVRCSGTARGARRCADPPRDPRQLKAPCCPRAASREPAKQLPCSARATNAPCRCGPLRCHALGRECAAMRAVPAGPASAPTSARTKGAAPEGPVTLMAFVRPSGPSSTSYSTSSPSRRLRKPSTWMLV
jgi:hypothetical protein